MDEKRIKKHKNPFRPVVFEPENLEPFSEDWMG